MIIMRKYKRELPEVCCGERARFFFPFLSFFLFFFFFHVGLLHRSHSPRQFACLSESEKGGLSALTPHRGCASYPNRPLLAFKSRAPTSPSCSTLLSCALLSRANLHPSLPVNKPASLRGRESPGYFLMRSRSARVLFTVIKQTGASLCRWGESLGFSLVFLLLLLLLLLGSYDCRLLYNSHHFLETTSALTRCFFLSDTYLLVPFPPAGASKHSSFEGYCLLVLRAT